MSIHHINTCKFIDMTMLMRPIIGIYALYRDETCIYVGQSINIVWRLAQHKSKVKRDPGFFFNKVWIAQCHRHELDQEELNAIKNLQPLYNKTSSGPRPKGKYTVPQEIMNALLQKSHMQKR